MFERQEPDVNTTLIDIRLVRDLFDKFYEQVKHGDDAHQKWLKDEMEKFKEENLNEKKSNTYTSS